MSYSRWALLAACLAAGAARPEDPPADYRIAKADFLEALHALVPAEVKFDSLSRQKAAAKDVADAKNDLGKTKTEYEKARAAYEKAAKSFPREEAAAEAAKFDAALPMMKEQLTDLKARETAAEKAKQWKEYEKYHYTALTIKYEMATMEQVRKVFPKK
jgi:hypothetical protein